MRRFFSIRMWFALSMKPSRLDPLSSVVRPPPWIVRPRSVMYALLPEKYRKSAGVDVPVKIGRSPG